MSLINRNVSIVVVLLVLVVIAGYLVWLRSRVSSSDIPTSVKQVQEKPTVAPTFAASPSAAPSEEATGSVRQKTATPGGTRR